MGQLADMFAAQLAELRERDEQLQLKIRQDLDELHRIADELAAIDLSDD
jgi:hypothetical protein